MNTQDNSFSAAVRGGQLLLLDGGLGTMLAARGGSIKSGDNNLEHPQAVLAVHREYFEAGSMAVATNTFALNPFYAADQGMTEDYAERSLCAGCELALEAAAAFKRDHPGRPAYVLGDLGPCGKLLTPLGPAEPEAVAAAYVRQIQLMSNYPLDALFIETVFDLNEAELIAAAARQAAPDLPLLLSMTFSSLKRGGCTIMGNTTAQIARAALDWGCLAVGANCGDLSPEEYAAIVAGLRQNCDLPLLIQPNAGKPRLVGDQVFYDLTPADFAGQMQLCADAGATLLGGCCGTTPLHIQALYRRFIASEAEDER